ncbi:putative 3-hydroxyisobutyryl-CoA hydrolase 3 [Carex rostrata]
MGAGAGFSLMGRFRVVTENTVFAMPEPQIGLFPDVGASYFLSRLQGFFGEYMGLTGTKMGGAEMLASGLATHFVSSKNLEKLEESLNNVETDDERVIHKIINQYSENPPLIEGSPLLRIDSINKFFSKGSVEEIVASLEQESIEDKDNWIYTTIQAIKNASPASLKIFLRSIREGRKQTYKKCIEREHIMLSHVIRRTISGDLYEGIAAKFLDKTGCPKWDPPSLEEVTNEMVDKCFKDLKEDEDWPPLNLPSKTDSIALAYGL